MARYIVLRIDDNQRAQNLIDKLSGVRGLDIVGLFASPTKLCPGASVCGPDRTYRRSRRWGTTHCSVCKLAVSSAQQQPRNLLNDEGLHPRFVDMGLSVWEPYMPPLKRYGAETIERKRLQVATAAERLNRAKRRANRGE